MNDENLNMDEILAQMGNTQGASVDPIIEAKAALKKDATNDFTQAYNVASETLDTPEFASARYLIGFFSTLSVDITYSVWEPIKQILSSDIAKDIAKYNFEEDLTPVLNLITGEGNIELPEEYIAIIGEEKVNRGLDGLKIMREGPKNLADYAAKVDKTPDEVLASPEDKLEFIKMAYGSLGKYEQVITDSSKQILPYLEQAKMFEDIPFGTILPLFISSQLDEEEMECINELGIDFQYIGNIASKYVGELSRFSVELIKASTQIRADEIAMYKTLDEKINA